MLPERCGGEEKSEKDGQTVVGTKRVELVTHLQIFFLEGASHVQKKIIKIIMYSLFARTFSTHTLLCTGRVVYTYMI